MKKALAISSFPSFAIQRQKSGNSLFYHPCCMTWTTRSCSTIRETHLKSVKWVTFLSTLDPDIEHQDKAIIVKLIEEGNLGPVLLNKPCQARRTILYRQQCSLEEMFEPEALLPALQPLPDDSVMQSSQMQVEMQDLGTGYCLQ